MNLKNQILLVGKDDERMGSLSDEFARSGIRARTATGPESAHDALALGGLDAAVVFEPAASADSPAMTWVHNFVVSARDRLMPVLLVIPPEGDWRNRARAADSWALTTAPNTELVLRTLDLLDERIAPHTQNGGVLESSLFTSKLLGMVVHDLRTPLNVIGLTIRAIEQTNPDPNPELLEDLGFLHDNARQIERLLAQLGEYCRLLEGGDDLTPVDFEPRTFFPDLIEEAAARPGPDPLHARLEIAPDCPPEVTLDPSRLRLAFQQAISNARTAAAGAPILVRVSGGGSPDRLVIEIEVDKPPPASLQPTILKQDRFERLAGSAAERRGLDLAIAAWVAARFGGSARLDVRPERGTSLVFDWPARIPSPVGR